MSSSDAVEVAVADKVTSVIVRGDFDLLLTDTFVTAAGRGRGDIEVDLSQVTFLDSAGIRALVNVATEARGDDRRFRVVDATVAARRVIEICGLEEFLDLQAPGAQ